MARPRKKAVRRAHKKRSATRKAGRRRPAEEVLVPTVATPWERNDAVLKLTRAIQALDRATKATYVANVVRLGGLLVEVRQLLPEGEWTRWLAHGVHFDERTAYRYLAVHAWATRYPTEFGKVKELDITKIYALLPLDRDLRRRLYDRAIAIPKTRLKLTLHEMNGPQLGRVIKDLTATPDDEDHDPVPELLQATRHRLAALQANTHQLIEHAADIDRDTIVDLYNDLLEVADQLERAFDL